MLRRITVQPGRGADDGVEMPIGKWFIGESWCDIDVVACRSRHDANQSIDSPVNWTDLH
jgi:hypothetical protein